MRPIGSNTASPFFMVGSLWRNKDLVVRMTSRSLALRYKGSLLGLFWSFLTPLLMLGVYSFMFLYVFQARWGNAPAAAAGGEAYVPILFTGLIVHAFLAEIITGSPSIILANVNFVKKVVFPLEILAFVNVLSAFTNAMTAWIILVALQTFLGGHLHVTALLFPLVLLPLAVIGLGVSWMISAIGVFVRDIAQVAGFLATATLFLSPIFFPLSALPEEMQTWMFINPLTLIVEQAREVVVYGRMPDMLALGLYMLIAILFASFGFAVFQKLRKGFADVL
jgi:lipopolysaccharide transport system permease protein